MSRFSTILENIPEIGRYILLGSVIFYISFLFPDSVKFKYQYGPSQTWAYDDLEAPFDFAIKKTEATIEEEKQRLRSSFSPYYRYDSDIASIQKKQFSQELKDIIVDFDQDPLYEGITKNAAKYEAYGLRLLDQIYKKGIIELDISHPKEDGNYKINVIYPTSTEQLRIVKLFTPQTAYDFVTDSLPFSGLEAARILLSPLENALKSNIQFQPEFTENKYNEVINSQVVTSKGMVPKGTVIVTRNGVITDTIYQQLESLKAEYVNRISKNKSSTLIFFGYLLLTSLILGVYMAYLKTNALNVYLSFRQLTFMLMWIVLYSTVVYLLVRTEMMSLYALPFCLAPIIISNFYSARLALFTHIVIILIASFLSPLGYEFTFIQVLVGIVAVLSNVQTRYSSKFFLSIFYLLIVYQLTYFGLSLIKEGTIQGIEWSAHGWLFLNAFLTLLAYPLVPLLEKIFGFTSDITLVELSDLNHPLLKELSLKAPGTFQHSLQVGNLAEPAATHIGANALLVKVAALYHDIGKMAAPDYYIENQNKVSPHDKLSYLESAEMIIQHVTEGLKMAKKASLPKVIIDFIASHHGTTRTEFFYRKYLEENPNIEVDESKFRYPGPNPKSKEETILMIADSLEAATKSLKEKTEASINDLTDKIIAGKITQGQFVDSQLTFDELAACTAIFKKVLKSIHHVRIEYPEEKKEA